MVDWKDNFRQRLKQEVKRRHSLSAPVPSPRYDEVFFEGVQVLFGSKVDGKYLGLASLEESCYGSSTMETNMINKMNTVLAGLKIRAECTDARRHRHLAYYDVRLEPGTRISQLESSAREIALDIQSKTFPTVKPITEKGIVRLQVAMHSAPILPLERLVAHADIPAAEKSLLPFCLGETGEGELLWIDFARNPHTLIAGSTGSGKSVMLHSLIANAAYLEAHGLRDIKVFLVDPKRGAEFSLYKTMRPIIREVISEYDKVILLLEHAADEMERRYEYMRETNIKSIQDNPEAFPIWLIIIDEVSDLMGLDKSKDFQSLVVRLAQKARAAGIYLVMATQRPDVSVLTGLIKANFPARISCRTASAIDSKVILDKVGAEALLGDGDAILSNMEHDRIRFQGAFSNPERTIKNYFWIKRNLQPHEEVVAVNSTDPYRGRPKTAV